MATATASPQQAPAPRPPRQRLNKLERTQLRRDLAHHDKPPAHRDTLQDSATAALDWLPLADHAAHPCPVVFTPDGSYAFVASGAAVKVYSVQSTELMSTLSIRPYADTASPSSPTTPAALRRATVSAVLLSPSNPRQLVVAATDGKVRLWDYLEGRLLRTLELGAPVLHATANAALPDQLFVALGTASGTPGEASVYLVSLRAAKHLVDGVVSAADPTTPVQPARRVRLATPRVVRALALSPDGAVLASLNPRAVNLARTADIQRGFTQSVPAAGDDEVLTTIAFHPSENYFATGNAKGQIRLWYDVLGGGAGATEGAVAAPSTSVLHWHAHAVSALAFTPNGAYLLSGGLEAVLVLWQLHSGHQEYVPRLGAPVVTLTVLDGTRDNPEQQVAARLGDGSVVFVGSQRLKVGKTISGLKADASSRPTFAPARPDAPTPLALDPSTSSLVLPAAHPSSLQFYSPREDATVLELEVAPSNRVTGADLDRPLEPTRVERVAFSTPEEDRDKTGGYWMATVDSWVREGFAPVRQLKLWRKDGSGNGFVLSTRIDRPHDAPITAMAFSPSSKSPLLLTTSADGSIKLWAPTSASPASTTSWACRAALSHRHSTPVAAAWSTDGSMFAIAHHLRAVTLWTVAGGGSLIHSFPATSVGRVRHVAFVEREGTGLVVAGARGTLMWDLLTLEEVSATTIDFATLAVAPGSSALLGTEDGPGAPAASTSASASASGTSAGDSAAAALLYTLAPAASTSQSQAQVETRPLPFAPRQLLALPLPASSTSSASSSSAPVSLAAMDPSGSVSLFGAAASLGGSVAPSALPHASGLAKEGLFDEIFGRADSALPKGKGKGKARAEEDKEGEEDKGRAGVVGKGAAVLLETPAHVLPPVRLLWRELLRAEPLPAAASKPANVEAEEQEEDQGEAAGAGAGATGPAAFSALGQETMRGIFAARLMGAAQ
ncbi:WD40-repeat-containing domain protein [Rhodotorula diobovata]|uniref:WD40-repeat-containing domain protein n=1 Tax=Rhodotorula diobovata TaxID=5288 RepID=A0A5C5G251_9BASI|nr:WD40-repeat-containing domain protein [Rhodotorula diobovata]